MLVPAFLRFSAKVLAGEPGIFFSEYSTDGRTSFYFGTGDYDLVSFDDSIYPKFSVTSWQGTENLNYAFKDTWGNDFDPLQPSADLESLNFSEIFDFEITESEAKDWIDKVNTVIDLQKAGEAWVLNLAHDHVSGRFDGEIDIRATLCGLFYQFLKLGKDHCAGLIITNEQIICSMSPELFIQKDKRDLLTRPIKGTGTQEYLNNSVKEKSELDMITDLLRNDLGQICERVEVVRERFLVAEKHFYSARSEITGVCEGLDWAAYHKLLPAGSISGAPKKRVCEIIKSLEAFDRDYYTGTFGVQVSPDQAIYNILIRTLFVNLETHSWSFPLGVGITAESDPEAEWQETLDKAKLLTDLTT